MPHQSLLQPYWENQAHLGVVDDLLYDDRIVVARAMGLEVLDCIHLWSPRCQQVLCQSLHISLVAWIVYSYQRNFKRCVTCAKDQPVPREPLMPSSFPRCPWERIPCGTKFLRVLFLRFLLIFSRFAKSFCKKKSRKNFLQKKFTPLSKLHTNITFHT